MERKQFEEIQETINKLRGVSYNQRTEIATAFADMLDTTYKKFDYMKFMDACLVSDKSEQGLQAMAGGGKGLHGIRKGGLM